MREKWVKILAKLGEWQFSQQRRCIDGGNARRLVSNVWRPGVVFGVQCTVQCAGPPVGSSQSAGEGGGGGGQPVWAVDRTGKVVEKPAVGSVGVRGHQLVGQYRQLIPANLSIAGEWVFLLSEIRLSANSGIPDSTRSVMQMRVLCEPWQSLKLGEGAKNCNFSLKRAGEESALFEVLAASYPGCGRAGGAVLQRSKQLLLLLCLQLSKTPSARKHPNSFFWDGTLSLISSSGLTRSSGWVWLKPLMGLLVSLLCCDRLPSVKTARGGASSETPWCEFNHSSWSESKAASVVIPPNLF